MVKTMVTVSCLTVVALGFWAVVPAEKAGAAEPHLATTTPMAAAMGDDPCMAASDSWLPGSLQIGDEHRRSYQRDDGAAVDSDSLSEDCAVV